MSFDRAVDAILGARSILCSCHQRPDADALGSTLALARALKGLSKEVTVYIPDALNSSIAFLPKEGEVLRALPDDSSFDLLMMSDTAARSLLPAGLPKGVPMLLLDHHAVHDLFGEITVRDVDVASTGELALELIDRLYERAFDTPPALTLEIAEPLYAAIVADTGGFRYAGTRPGTLRAGARLLEAGVDPSKIAELLFERWPLGRFRLLAVLIDRMEILYDGRVTLVEVTRALLDELGADDDMLDGLINYGRKLEGVQLTVLISEAEAGEGGVELKIGLRSRGDIDSAALASAFGGGGHRYAAGARSPLPMSELRKRLLAEIDKVIG